MVSAWRKCMFGATTCFGFTCCLFISGCQSWSNMGSPMQSATRVPPPGTGSYNMQGAYYNNPATATTSNLSNSSATAAPVVQASATSDTYNPAGANFPTSQYTGGTAVSFASTNAVNPNAFSNSSGVSSAVYTDNGSSGAQVVPASSMPTNEYDNSGNPTATTNLQWK